MHGGHMAATDSPTALRILRDVNVGLSTRYSYYPHTAVARVEGGSFAAQAKALHLGQPPQYAGTPVRSTGIGIPAPGMRGRQLAATDSPNAARHSWGPYARPSTWYWYTRVLQWLSPVPAILLAQSRTVWRSEGRQSPAQATNATEDRSAAWTYASPTR